MFYTAKDLRQVALWIRRARLTLQASLVTVMQYEDGPSKGQELARLQERFNGVCRMLPVWLRSERFLSKHVAEPAKRELGRRGLLEIARELRSIKDGEWKP